MAKLCLKKPSKRQPARRRYKIEKKVRDHNRKTRKEAKKAERKGIRKTIHVPNLCPFKEEIIKSAEEYKRRQEQERQKAKEAAKEAKLAKKSQTLDEFVEDVKEKQIGIDEQVPNEEVITKKSSDGKQRSFYREFQKVVAAADVILEVVDARDPLGTRCPQVDELVRASGDNKRLVLVLNKADLIGRENLEKWLKYLRRSVPTIPFKCSTQSQGKRLGRRKLQKGQIAHSGAVCMGAEGLTSLLANYTRNKGIKTSIRVGVVGLPNVGKSSLVNSLKRSRACKVGAIPGVTRNLQEVQLDSKVKLLDSPGLALASTTDPHAALKNSVLTSDATEAASMILARANRKQLADLYLVNDFSDTNLFLSVLAKRFGKFGKGGVTDLQAAAQILLHDWNRGKISYHTEPPEDTDAHISSRIISTTDAPEFDLEAYDKENMVFSESMDTEADAKSTDGEYVVTAKKGRKKRGGLALERQKGESLKEAEIGLKTKKLNKLIEKKRRKSNKKTARNVSTLAETLTDINL